MGPDSINLLGMFEADLLAKGYTSIQRTVVRNTFVEVVEVAPPSLRRSFTDGPRFDQSSLDSVRQTDLDAVGRRDDHHQVAPTRTAAPAEADIEDFLADFVAKGYTSVQRTVVRNTFVEVVEVAPPSLRRSSTDG